MWPRNENTNICCLQDYSQLLKNGCMCKSTEIERNRKAEMCRESTKFTLIHMHKLHRVHKQIHLL